LFNLHRRSTNSGAKSGDPKSSYDEFEGLLFSDDNATAGRALRGLIHELKRSKRPLPEVVVDDFQRAIGLRNFLAHRYLVRFGLLGGDKAAQRDLAAQLPIYSEFFRHWFPVLDEWIVRMVEVLNITAEELDEQFAEQCQNEGENKLIGDVQLSAQQLTETVPRSDSLSSDRFRR
jgi:hypothetical protein